MAGRWTASDYNTAMSKANLIHDQFQLAESKLPFILTLSIFVQMEFSVIFLKVTKMKGAKGVYMLISSSENYEKGSEEN